MGIRGPDNLTHAKSYLKSTGFKLGILVNFGESVKVSLFGSRTDDHKKGGDIDLFISCVNPVRLNLQSKIDFLIRLKSIIGDQKIDVILDTPSKRGEVAFYHSIQQTAVTL
jgi:predicted nucleotidyltransferase